MEDLLVALRAVRDASLDLFGEYIDLAIQCKRTDDMDGYRYWIDQAVDINQNLKKIEQRIYIVTKGECVR